MVMKGGGYSRNSFQKNVGSCHGITVRPYVLCLLASLHRPTASIYQQNDLK